MRQITIFDLALPEIWAVGAVPESDGIYRCRVKFENGDIGIRDIECKDNIFVFDEGKILAWR